MKVNVFKPGTNLRHGGSTRGPSNIITVLQQPGLYNALYQCTGQDVTEGDDKNCWWVKIETPVGEGWVSAVRIKEGPNNGPIPGVEERPTVFC